MKTRMNKLAVFVMMAAIAIFISAATASAHDPLGIIGEYAFSGGGNLIMTPYANWDPANPFTLVDPTHVSFSSYHAHGVLTFRHNGTGTIDMYSLGTPSAPIWSGATAWSPSYYHITYPFTYTVNHDGEITVEANPNTMKQEVINPVTGMPTGMVVYRDHYSLRGWVSVDHKTITLATPGPRIDTNMLAPALTPLSKVISHDAHVCNRLND
ncbi:MAG: hypothetical protein ACXWMK_10220 [Syntrophales bacterium]